MTKHPVFLFTDCTLDSVIEFNTKAEANAFYEGHAIAREASRAQITAYRMDEVEGLRLEARKGFPTTTLGKIEEWLKESEKRKYPVFVFVSDDLDNVELLDTEDQANLYARAFNDGTDLCGGDIIIAYGPDGVIGLAEDAQEDDYAAETLKEINDWISHHC